MIGEFLKRNWIDEIGARIIVLALMIAAAVWFSNGGWFGGDMPLWGLIALECCMLPLLINP